MQQNEIYYTNKNNSGYPWGRNNYNETIQPRMYAIMKYKL